MEHRYDAGSVFCESCGTRLSALPAAAPPVRLAEPPPVVAPRPVAPLPRRSRPRGTTRSQPEGHDPHTQKQIRKYFQKFPLWTIFFLVWTLVGILQTSGDESFSKLPAGAAMIGVAVWIAILLVPVVRILFWLRRPTDEEVDAWREDACRRVEARAVDKLSLDIQAAGMGEPVTLMTPQFLDLILGKRSLSARGCFDE